MTTTETKWTTAEKLGIFESCFSGLTHVYGTYDPSSGRVWQVKAPVTREVFLRHLSGRQPYGVYLLVDDSINAMAVDFDDHDPQPALDYLRRAAQCEIVAYLERSKSKGWHAWTFFGPQCVPAAKARMVAQAILNGIGKPATEVFPKQDRIIGKTNYGNFINAPLFGRFVQAGRTVFVDPNNDLRPFSDQWAVLADAQRVAEEHLDQIIQAKALDGSQGACGKMPVAPGISGYLPTIGTVGLPPCVQRILAEGVTANQRVACFRAAIALKLAGLSKDLVVATLESWARKNRPDGGKQLLTHEEVRSQVGFAYAKDYRSHGCEDNAVSSFCDARCPIARGRAAEG